MATVFMGTPEFARTVANAIHDAYPIDLVITQPDKPIGRKKTMHSPPLKVFAEEKGIECMQPRRIHDVLDTLERRNIDLIITAAYGQILPTRLLRMPALGAINVHASLLPKLRGGAPIQRAIERGYRETGVTIMYMSEKMDAGDIISQRKISISDDETSASLFEKLARLGGELLKDTLPDIFNNKVSATPQKTSEVTYAYTIKREEEMLDFTETAQTLERKIRAFYPSPACYFTVNGVVVKVYGARIIEGSNEAPGTIIAHAKTGPVIQCGRDALLIEHIQPAGKKQMAARDYLNGQGRTALALGIKVNT